MLVEIAKEFRLESAHFLPNVPKGHKCKNLHGHSYRIVVRVRGPLDPHFGWVMDLGVLSDQVDPIITEIDHRVLNTVPGLENPTSENLALWLFRRVKEIIPLVSSITVKATGRVAVTVSDQSCP